LSTRRIQLVVAYDGTDYCGWAAQTGLPTVHRTLTEAVREVSREENEITGASRTDGGAHAKGQSCHFDTARPIRAGDWPRAINSHLPGDVAVLAAVERPPSWHARHDATGRTYVYRYLCGPRDPERARFVHRTHHDLDAEAMDRAAQTLVGEHDFRAFSEEVEPNATARREVRCIRVERAGDEVRLTVAASSFVRGMMRRIAGALLEIGRGKRSAGDLEALLDPNRRDAVQWPVVLPPSGLCLMQVHYGEPNRTA
jgi:tRNA pseudouridine38-40 synthase